jgi:hypothetical protein
MVFALLGAPVIVLNLWRLLTGQVADKELIGIRESDDMPHGEPRT